MNVRWFGAVAIIVGCGGFGFRMAAIQRKQEKELHDLVTALDILSNELRYRLSPLPELCSMVAKSLQGNVGKVFRLLYDELNQQIASDACYCMNAAVYRTDQSPLLKKLLLDLGRTLGHFDLDGQIQGIEAVRQEAVDSLDKLTKDKEARLRSYQTLGLCAGAALAILLM